MSSTPPPSAEPDGTPLVGRLLVGRYRLERPIASGGMAQVWEGLDQTLARRVAVKILHPHLASDETFVRRFRAEAVAAARLSHPSIVSVYDTCSVDGLEAIVMELVTGTTVRADLDAHGPMKLPAVLAIGTQVADALGAAHAAGLVHRDVKPANILLSADGRVLVADFGIAKAAEGSDLTAAGAMIGTAKYLAPEQVRDGPIDGRADLYALGVVLYEALAGVAPFVADTDAATALARLHRDPRPLQELRPEVPEAVALVVAQAMRRDPDERFASAAALRTALLAAGAEPARAPQAAAAAAAGALAPTQVAPPASPPPPPPPPAPAPKPAPHQAPAPLPVRQPSPAPAAPSPAPIHATLDAIPEEPTRRRRGLVVGLAVVLAIAIGGFAATRLDSGPSQGRTARALSSASILDPPPGDATEHDDEAPLAIDGDPSTAWQSETYRDPASVGGKRGVGLAVSLERTSSVDRVELDTREAGWSVQVYATTGDLPTTLDGWGAPLASIADADAASSALQFDAVDADHVLLWFTKLPSSGAVAVSEVTVLGR